MQKQNLTVRTSIQKHLSLHADWLQHHSCLKSSNVNFLSSSNRNYDTLFTAGAIARNCISFKLSGQITCRPLRQVKLHSSLQNYASVYTYERTPTRHIAGEDTYVIVGITRNEKKRYLSDPRHCSHVADQDSAWQPNFYDSSCFSRSGLRCLFVDYSTCR